jgi:glucuronoarabinoxylan endo-1,4-beta-xylanase
MIKITSLISATILYAVSASAQPTITVNSATQYQTIKGWGQTGGTNTQYEGTPPYLVKQIINESVNGLGLNTLRYESYQGNYSQSYAMCKGWEFENDNASPDTLNFGAIDTVGIDYYMQHYFVPYKQAVSARGETFGFYVSPSWYYNGSTGDIPAFLRYSPGEYAEYIISNLNYIKNKYGLVPDYVNICNEAGNNNVFTPAMVATMIKTVGPRLQQAGYTNTGIQFPECVSAQTSWTYIQAVMSDPDVWPYIKLLSYHLYGTNDPYRADISAFAQTKGIGTAQTEYIGLGIQLLYQDLTLGGVSYWDFYGNSDYMPLNTNSTWFSYGAKYWTTGQVIKHVRPGAVRIGATSTDTTIQPLSFSNGGQLTTVILNMNTASTTQTITLSGLPQGTYAIGQSTGSGTPSERGLITVPASGTCTLTLTAQTVISIYPHSTNLPPYATAFAANPTYLDLPTSSVALSCSGIDPELSTVTYHWAVDSFPAGASVVLSNATISNPTATGMTVAGDYVFAVTMSDGSATTTKTITVMVFPNNQPPIISALQSRLPVIVTLPIDTVAIQGAAYDLEADALTYSWTVVSQPVGATALIVTPNAVNRTTVKNLTIAGNYVFKYSVSDPTHTVSRNITVPVYPVNHAPVINTISALPLTINTSADSSLLTATTSDPDGDIVTRWWTVASSPTGANPTFSAQGERITEVRNLNVSGTYVFTLYAIDRTLYTTSTVTVTVTNTTGIENKEQTNNLSIYPNPGGDYFTVNTNRTEKQVLQLFDVSGKLVLCQTINTITTIDVTTIQDGVYTISITGSEGIINKKLVIVK